MWMRSRALSGVLKQPEAAAERARAAHRRVEQYFSVEAAMALMVELYE
jgi:hypothetical protein